MDGTDGKPGSTFLHQLLQQLQCLPRQIRPAAAHQNPNPCILQLLPGHANPLLHLRAELIFPVGQQNAQRQQSGGRLQRLLMVFPAGDIPCLLQGSQYPLTHLSTDIGAAIEHPIHGPPGYPCHFRHHLNGRTLSHVLRLLSCVLLHMFF